MPKSKGGPLTALGGFGLLAKPDDSSLKIKRINVSI